MPGSCIKGELWTAAELRLLTVCYQYGGIAAARAALPHRSVASLYHKTYRARLAQRRRRWAALDDAKLRKLWSGELSLADIARALGRSEITTYWRAGKIGLPRGVQPGWEYLSAAAERTGYGTTQLRAILKAAGVALRPVIARPSQRRGKRKGRRKTFHMVWAEDVTLAVADRLERETVQMASQRVGVSSETLRRRLRALGVKPPRKKKARWLVSEEQVARALAAKLVRTRRERGRYSGARFAA